MLFKKKYSENCMLDVEYETKPCLQRHPMQTQGGHANHAETPQASRGFEPPTVLTAAPFPASASSLQKICKFFNYYE